MVKLEPKLLGRSPEEVVRHLCLGLLEEASEALVRMEGGEDEEALHDFRVALRRLRSTMRAYRKYLEGSAGKKMRRRVKALASTTNLARDAEVQIEYLTRMGEKLDGEARDGTLHLLERVRGKQQSIPSARALREAFEPLRKNLTKKLSRMQFRSREEVRDFLSAAGELVRAHAVVLEEKILATSSPQDADHLHQSRIEAKRLRYLLEPLQLGVREARPLIKKMKSLQDCLGDLQDTRVLTEEISEALESVALEQARVLRELALRHGETAVEETLSTPPHPGLLAVLKIQRERRDRRFEELIADWHGATGRDFFRDVRLLTERLTDGEHRPRRRRFLLEGLPEIAKRQPSELVREGWLPGKEIRERIRSIRSGRRVRYQRIVEKNGSPPLEETATRGVFDALWPATEGRRLESRRYEVSDGRARWIVERFSAPPLVIAEVEGNDAALLPDWIRESMRREVTGVRRYARDALARQAQRASSLRS